MLGPVSRRRERTPTTQATQALDAAGVAWTAHTYVHDPRATSFGLEAAEALGVDPARVYKTLVLASGRDLGVAIVPVTCSVDLKAASAALGMPKGTGMADPAAAERSSGYVTGGISPLGQRTALTTVLDASAAGHETIYVSGGRRGFDVELAPADLVRLLDAVVGPISRT